MKYIKPIAIVYVCITILFFIVGYFVAKSQIVESFDKDTYLTLATILGGTASILGLLAMVVPSITTADLKRLESESLKEVAKLAEEMQMADEQIDKRNKQNLTLKDQNKNLELQIKKASLILSLENKLRRNYSDLSEIYHESLKNKKQLEALNQEIADAENGDELQKIIELVKTQENKQVLDFESAFWLKPNLFGIGVDINALTKQLIKTIREK